MLDVVRAFEVDGHRALIWELEPVWRMYEADPKAKPKVMSDLSVLLANLIRANRIDLSIGMWANGLFSVTHPSVEGRLVPFFEAVRCPHVMFWLDAPQWAHSGTFRQHFGLPLLKSPALLSVINNPGTAREMTELLGFDSVLPRSYGVNESVFRPHADEKREFDIVFGLGPGDPKPTPTMLEELEKDEPDTARIRHEQAERVTPEVAALLAKLPGDRVAPAAARELAHVLVTSQLASRDTPLLDRIDAVRRDADAPLAAAIDALRADPRLYVEVTMKVRLIENWERAFTFAHLARRFRCAAFGTGSLAAWGADTKHLGDLPYAGMARAYSRAAIGLNVMRWQDDQGLNLKPFEITASGAACLCARRVGLDALFDDDREIIAFATPGEARRKAGELLKAPERLRTIAEAGRARTLHDHTWTAWTRDVVARIGVR
ncbi:MAG: glycosyltransferase [Phycisphaerales bacterium]